MGKVIVFITEKLTIVIEKQKETDFTIIIVTNYLFSFNL